MERYYSVSRPVAPGTFPKRGAVSIENFGSRVFCVEIGREAWGWIEYDRELDPALANDYELVRERTP